MNEIKEVKQNMPAIAKGEKKAMAPINIKGLVLGKKARKDGRYMGKFTVDGEYKYFYAKSYEQLELLAIEIVKDKKKLDKISNFTYKQWAEKWLELYHKKNVTETVYKNDCAVFKNHIFPILANKLLNKLTAIEIQETINKCPFSRQRQLVANLLVASVRKAYETDVLKKDITKAIEKPSHSKEEGRPLSYEEEKTLYNFLNGHELGNYIMLLINSGLRRNEALGLQWKHLDFERNTILVEQQIDMENKITKRLKTKSSKRIVKMFPAIKKVFQSLIPVDKEKRIFVFKPEFVTKEFKKICDKLGLSNFSIKGCRTTFATRCAERGIADKVVQSWMGHSKLDTTVNVYQKVTDNFVEQEFKKILNIDFDNYFDNK